MSAEIPINYKQIGEKILSGEKLDNLSLQTFLDTGLGFASKLINENNQVSNLIQKRNEAFKQLFPYVVLLRITSLAKASKDQKISNSKSTELFTALKNNFIETFDLPSNLSEDTEFENKFMKLINESEALFPEDKIYEEIGDDIYIIRNWVILIVPENPKPTVKPEPPKFIHD